MSNERQYMSLQLRPGVCVPDKLPDLITGRGPGAWDLNGEFTIDANGRMTGPVAYYLSLVISEAVRNQQHAESVRIKAKQAAATYAPASGTHGPRGIDWTQPKFVVATLKHPGITPLTKAERVLATSGLVAHEDQVWLNEARRSLAMSHSINPKLRGVPSALRSLPDSVWSQNMRATKIVENERTSLYDVLSADDKKVIDALLVKKRAEEDALWQSMARSILEKSGLSGAHQSGVSAAPDLNFTPEFQAVLDKYPAYKAQCEDELADAAAGAHQHVQIINDEPKPVPGLSFEYCGLKFVNDQSMAPYQLKVLSDGLVIGQATIDPARVELNPNDTHGLMTADIVFNPDCSDEIKKRVTDLANGPTVSVSNMAYVPQPVPDAAVSKEAALAKLVARFATLPAQDTKGEFVPDASAGLTVPGAGDWTFQNRNVADNFDQHVREQLPWYDLATGIVAHVGRHYLPRNGVMYDIGASTGNVTRCLRHEIVSREVEAISIDNSESMRDKWQGLGTFVVDDARTHPYRKYHFGVCFLTLMFLPVADQRELLDRLVKNIADGGALLIFDKTEAATGYIGTVMQRLTLAGKIAHGASYEDVVKKELSLAGVQRPINPQALLARHGAVEVFRFGEFAGWVIQG